MHHRSSFCKQVEDLQFSLHLDNAVKTWQSGLSLSITQFLSLQSSSRFRQISSPQSLEKVVNFPLTIHLHKLINFLHISGDTRSNSCKSLIALQEASSGVTQNIAYDTLLCHRELTDIQFSLEVRRFYKFNAVVDLGSFLHLPVYDKIRRKQHTSDEKPKFHSLWSKCSDVSQHTISWRSLLALLSHATVCYHLLVG